MRNLPSTGDGPRGDNAHAHPSGAGDGGDAHRIGRPRGPGVDDAILDAAIALLAERGIEGTTVNAVIARSGVARATVYLRWPTRSALIAAAVRRAMGQEERHLTGDIEADMRGAARQVCLVLGDETFRSVLPAFLDGLLARPAAERLPYETMVPGRSALADEYAGQARAAGLRDEVSPGLVVDLIIGGLLNHALATGTPPGPAEAEQVIDIVLNGVSGKRSR